MSKTTLLDTLTAALADSYALYLKTQNYHWNVEGPHFYALHKMFEEQYDDLASAIDEIAERIRGLGHKAPGTFAAFQKHTQITDGDNKAKATSMVDELHQDNQKIVKTLTDAMNAAQAANDESTADLMIARIQHHEKVAWMLRSSK